MLRISQLKLPVDHSREELEDKVKKLLRCRETPRITIVRRSIDARKKPRLYFNYILNVQVTDQAEVYRRCDKNQVLLWEETAYRFPVSGYRGKKRPVIIGTGPAGLFADICWRRPVSALFSLRGESLWMSGPWMWKPSGRRES